MLHRKCDTPYLSSNSSSELANEIVEFFSDKITRIRVDLDAAAPIHPVPEVDRACPCTFDEFSMVTVDEVRKCAVKLIFSKSCILTLFLAQDVCSGHTAVPFISKIINTSLQSGQMPSQLKIANLRSLQYN